jgi:hypothetical protein
MHEFGHIWEGQTAAPALKRRLAGSTGWEAKRLLSSPAFNE